jgi:hypothetical protein
MSELTVDQALAQVMLLVDDDPAKRREIRRILGEVRSADYSAGYRDGWEEGSCIMTQRLRNKRERRK